MGIKRSITCDVCRALRSGIMDVPPDGWMVMQSLAKAPQETEYNLVVNFIDDSWPWKEFADQATTATVCSAKCAIKQFTLWVTKRKFYFEGEQEDSD